MGFVALPSPLTDRWGRREAAAIAVAATSVILAVSRRNLSWDALLSWGRSDACLAPARPVRRCLKVAILGGGIGACATALWMRDALSDQNLDIAIISEDAIGSCQTVKFFGERYEVETPTILESDVYARGLMRRFGLKERCYPGLNLPWVVFNGMQVLFCGVGATAFYGCHSVARIATAFRLTWRHGLWSVQQFWGVCRSAPDFRGLYAALREGAVFSHPRELLAVLGHGCLRLTERSAENWFMRERGLSRPLVTELAAPGMRARYGGQGCSQLHGFIGLLSCNSLGRCFSILGGNEQLPRLMYEAARPRGIQGTARIVRRVAAANPQDPSFEVAYELSDKGEPRSPVQYSGEADGLLVEAFHLVVFAHSLDNSALVFQDCCMASGGMEAAGGTGSSAAPILSRRCVAHFVKGTLNVQQLAPQRFAHDVEAVVPTMCPALVVTSEDSTAPFYSISLELPVDLKSLAAAREMVERAEGGEPHVYKVTGPRPLSTSDLKSWFKNSICLEAKPVEMQPCPQYSVPQVFRPFVLDVEGVYYINALEQAALSMEMSFIGARNVVNLMLDWVEQRRGTFGF